MAPYQEAAPPELREAAARELHVLTADGGVVKGGEAVVFVYEQIGVAPASLLRLPPFSLVREPLYRCVASHRPLFARWFFRPR